MNQTHNTDTAPWWETELRAIEAKQRSYLKARIPALRSDHDDLLDATLANLSDSILKYPDSFPESWFRMDPPEDQNDRKRLYALARSILNRRIADLFRKRVTLVSLSDPENPIDVPDPKASSLDRKLLIKRLLQVTFSALDEMSPKDRDLIALISEDDGVRKSLNPRDRQRLHRARKKLKTKIASHFGAELEDLLK